TWEGVVFSFLFVVLNLQVVIGQTRRQVWGSQQPRGAYIPYFYLGSLYFVTAGIVIPVAVLAGYLGDSWVWRLLAFLALTGQALMAAAAFRIMLTAPTEDD